MGKHTNRILELKSIYYSYHNTDGETPAMKVSSLPSSDLPAVANPPYSPSFQG